MEFDQTNDQIIDNCDYHFSHFFHLLTSAHLLQFPQNIKLIFILKESQTHRLINKRWKDASLSESAD